MASELRSLYRVCLRRTCQLPHHYLRQFFRLKFADDFRAISCTRSGPLQTRKLKRVHKTLSKIQGATAGHTEAFDSILDYAYGRKGKLRWELMEPLLQVSSSSNHGKKPKLPSYSPELKALLTSAYSRTTKALDRKSLANPPTLPARANPTSDEARLLGPLSKRREINVRWRYFVQEWKKIRPPLDLTEANIQDNGSATEALSKRFPFHNYGLLDELIQFSGVSQAQRPLTRRERLADADTPEQNISSTRHPSRWLRRRYLGLLGRIPILTMQRTRQGQPEYLISLFPDSLSHVLRGTSARLPPIDDINRSWLDGQREGKSK